MSAKKDYAKYTLEDFVKEVRECFSGLEEDDPERVRKFFEKDGEGYGICAFQYDQWKKTLPEAMEKSGATPSTWMQGRIDDAFELCNLEI